jgi:hypothetical protein
MTVKAFKLLSGEEIAGEITEETSEHYILDKARQLGLVQIPIPGNPEPQLLPQFVPWLLSNPEGKSLKISKTAVASGPMELASALERLYLDQTSALDLSTKIKT